MEYNPILIKKKKETGIVSLFVLNSLNKSPKSGYDLISELREFTKGAWVPSKGTMYPVLKKMEQDSLIIVKTVEKRSRKIFAITSYGKKYLKKIKGLRNESMLHIVQFRKIFAEIFKENCRFYMDELLEINDLANEIGSEQKEKVCYILKRGITDMRKLKQSQKHVRK